MSDLIVVRAVKSTCCALIVMVMLSGGVSAESLDIITSEEPPLSFMDESGRLTGISIDVLRAIQQRVGNTDLINVYPWSRLYHDVTKKPNVAAFTMARTKEREDKFHWITVVNRNAWMLFAKKGSGIKIKNLEDAKSAKSIGVVRLDVREKLLLDLGFQNLEPVKSWEQNIKKLLLDRVSLVFYAASGIQQTCRKAGLDCGSLEVAYSVKFTDAYIVMSKGTPTSTVEKWQKAAKQMKQDGTFKRIAQKWMVYLKAHYGLETHIHDGGLNLWKAK